MSPLSHLHEVTTSPDVVADIPLRAPRQDRLPWQLTLLGTAASAAGSLSLLLAPEAEHAELGLVLALLSLYMAAHSVRAFRWRRFNPRLVLTSHGITAPRSPHTPRLVTLEFADIDALSVHAAAGMRVLILATAIRQVVITSAQFGGPTSLASVEAYLRRRLSELPAGSKRLESFRTQAHVTVRALERKPRATYTVLGLLVAAFWAESSTGALDDPLMLIQLGANVPSLVVSGEWYRLASATFLHGSLLHLLVNGYGLMQLGGLLERLMGWQRYLWVFGISALTGAAASTFAGQALFSVGASTSLFGLLGAMAWLQMRNRAVYPALFRQTLWWWLVIGTLNAALPLLVPAIDGAAHVGGFVGGFLAAALVHAGRESLAAPTPPTWTQFAGVGAIAIILAGSAVAVQSALHTTDPRGLVLLDKLARSSSPAPELINLIAWETAIDPVAAAPALDSARHGIERALATDPSSSHIADTFATLLHRLGDHPGAVQQEAEVLLREGDAFSAGQLLRFGMAWRTAGAPLPRTGTPHGSSDTCLFPPEGTTAPGWGICHVERAGMTVGLAMWQGGGPNDGGACVPVPHGQAAPDLTITCLAWLDGHPSWTSLPYAPSRGQFRVFEVHPEPLSYP